MKDKPALALGKLIRTKRKALGYSTYELARAAGVTESTVLRFEQGEFKAPRPDKLARFAEALSLSLADVYAKAGYLVPAELPSFDIYLHAKYPKLPVRAVGELGELLRALAGKYGVRLDARTSTPPPHKS